MEPRLNTVLNTGVLKSVVTVKLVRHCQQWWISNTTKWRGGVLSRRGGAYIEVVWENDSEASLNYANHKGKDAPNIRGEQECN